MILNSRTTITMLTDAAARSAIGAVYITPSMPKRYGKISSSGSRKIICLVSERKIPFFGAPIEVTKCQLTGWLRLRNVQTRTMRKYRSAKCRYSSEPEPKMPIIWRGKSWKQRKATMEMAVAAKTAFL